MKSSTIRAEDGIRQIEDIVGRCVSNPGLESNAVEMVAKLADKHDQLERELAAEKADHADTQRQWNEALDVGLKVVKERDALRDAVRNMMLSLCASNIEQAKWTGEAILAAKSLTGNGFMGKHPLTQEELYDALGRAMQAIEKTPACIESTNAVTIVGDIRQSIGNKWNKPDHYAAERLRDFINR